MKQRVRRSLLDENLKKAFAGRWTAAAIAGRRQARSQFDFDGLSRSLRQMKERCIDQLPELVEQFETAATRAGAIVYQARDAEDANRYVLELARRKNVRSIVKSKSMLTEEIELRQYLEDGGIRVTETDIGEWIVQLAGEKPAHIVGPAVHKTIQQIAELFSKETGQPLAAEPQPLLDISRNTLRQRYAEADMGISGANFAIAETGSVGIVTNEGNGVMASTLPPVYVAMVGREKLVASMEDTLAIQRIFFFFNDTATTEIYTSLITGPSRSDAIPAAMPLAGQGPKEVHIVLVDNGRTRMEDSDIFREALYCIKCGACLNNCPVFGCVAGQTYGHIYQGGIGAILTAFLHGLDKAVDVAGLCMGCMACRDACPARIDIPRMVSHLKAMAVEEEGLPWKRKLVFGAVLRHPKRLERVLRWGSVVLRPFAGKDAMIRRLPWPLKGIAGQVSLPAISRRPLRDRLKQAEWSAPAAHPRVVIYSGCVADYAYPELGENAVELLKECGAETRFPREQTCCGAPAFYSGETKTALSLARDNIRALEEDSPDYIMTLCPGCAAMLKTEYPRLTAAEPEWNRRAAAVAGKIRDFSQLILELTPAAEKKAPRGVKVTYHDPCHLRRGLGIFDEPRRLLEREGFEIVEMPDSDGCCGFGGEMLLNHPELSGAVLGHKLDNVEAAGVDTVVTNCAPCILQLRGGLDKRGSKIAAVHTVQLLAGSKPATAAPSSR